MYQKIWNCHHCHYGMNKGNYVAFVLLTIQKNNAKLLCLLIWHWDEKHKRFIMDDVAMREMDEHLFILFLTMCIQDIQLSINMSRGNTGWCKCKKLAWISSYPNTLLAIGKMRAMDTLLIVIFAITILNICRKLLQ